MLQVNQVFSHLPIEEQKLQMKQALKEQVSNSGQIFIIEDLCCPIYHGYLINVKNQTATYLEYSHRPHNDRDTIPTVGFLMTSGMFQWKRFQLDVVYQEQRKSGISNSYKIIHRIFCVEGQTILERRNYSSLMLLKQNGTPHFFHSAADECYQYPTWNAIPDSCLPLDWEANHQAIDPTSWTQERIQAKTVEVQRNLSNLLALANACYQELDPPKQAVLIKS